MQHVPDASHPDAASTQSSLKKWPEQKIVLGLIVVATLIICVSLAGWIFDVPALQGFGVAKYRIWPLSSASFLVLCAGFWATVRAYRSAPFLVLAPLLVMLLALYEQVTGTMLGIDTILFPDKLAQFESAHPGRPGTNSIAVCGFLSLALLATMRRNDAFAELANLLATAALCFGLFSIVLLLSIVPGQEAMVQVFVSPLPGALATIALAAAFLMWRHEAGWTILLTANRARQPFVGLLLPMIIILPVLPTLIERWGRSLGAEPLGTELLAVLSNVAIIGFLLWLAVDRFTRQQAALREVTRALDMASIVLTRPDGTITYWSRGCEQLYGWTAAEAIGRRKYELLGSRGPTGLLDRPDPDGSAERELIERCRDGSLITVLERTQMLERVAQEPLLVLKILDISERVRTEHALRQSEARLAAAADTHKISISNWDVKTGRLELSPGSEQRLGFEPGGLATFDQWYAAVEPEDGLKVMDILARAAANQDEHITYSYRFNQPNGQVRTIEGSSHCTYDAQGGLVNLVGTHVDVTERVEREAASQLQSVVDTVPDATVVIDDQGVIRSFSAAAERMFAIASAEAIGRNVKFLMPEGFAAGHDASILRYLETSQRRVIGSTRELTARRADGTPFPIELNVGEAWLGDERIFTGVIRDVSDRIAAEKRLTELSSELAHISRQSAMSELAADLAHELNQPLSATANFLAAARILIERGEEGDRVADLLRMGEEQTLRSGEIIRRLRDFLAKREGEMRAESLEHIVREAVELVLFGTAQVDIRLTYRLDPAVDAIFADRIQVQQVLVNLLRNAVDALRDRPPGTKEIIIESRPMGNDMIEISVADSGPGIPKEVSEQLYSRFATTKDGSAMGIGLSISRRIAEAHGGTLVAENRPEGGAVFRFTLPALEEIEE